MSIDVFSTYLETKAPPGIATIDVFSIWLETKPPAAAPASIDVFGAWLETNGDAVNAQEFVLDINGDWLPYIEQWVCVGTKFVQ